MNEGARSTDQPFPIPELNANAIAFRATQQPAIWARPKFDEELRTVHRATSRRRQEFLAGRNLARVALRDLQVGAGPIPSGPQRLPIWPEGVKGSIAHCRGLVVASVTKSPAIDSLGIDAEPMDRQLSTRTVQAIRRGANESEIESFGVVAPLLLICAREAAFKAFSTLTSGRVGLRRIVLTFLPRPGRFRASVPSVELPWDIESIGYWGIYAQTLVTLVVIGRRLSNEINDPVGEGSAAQRHLREVDVGRKIGKPIADTLG